MSRISLLLVALVVSHVHCLRVHVATWNVADNKYMAGKIDRIIIGKLLEPRGDSRRADIYAVTLQENCFNCNSGNVGEVAHLFLEELGSDYVYNGVALTRDAGDCQLVACNVGLHGTTMMMVFSKYKLLSRSVKKFKTTSCSANLLGNAEKGVTGLQVTTTDKKKLCFAGLHLDSKSVDHRRDCMLRFLKETVPKDCTSIYVAGDFNVRTDKNRNTDAKGTVTLSESDMIVLQRRDEMSGPFPFTDDKTNMISYLNKNVKNIAISEPGVPIMGIADFVPTFKIEPTSGTRKYMANRPASWTDRVICHSCGKTVSYMSLNTVVASDHLPVVAVFDL